MRKLKTNKSYAKRLKVYKTGKVKRPQAFTGHILTKKSSNRKRRLRKSVFMTASSAKLARRLMPYG